MPTPESVSGTPKVLLQVAKLDSLIKWFGDPVLRTVCAELPVEQITEAETQRLADKLRGVLHEIRRRTGLGRALAAPQIGVSKRMIAVFQNESCDILINPRIIWASEEQGVFPEMCLSGVPLVADVIRPWEVEVEFFDLAGHPHRLRADPMLSRALQHEIDHLSGILFTDKADIKTIRFASNLEAYAHEAKLTRV